MEKRKTRTERKRDSLACVKRRYVTKVTVCCESIHAVCVSVCVEFVCMYVFGLCGIMSDCVFFC